MKRQIVNTRYNNNIGYTYYFMSHQENIGVNCSSTSIEKYKNKVTREVRLPADSRSVFS